MPEVAVVPRRLRGVRVRITVLATLVTGLAMLLAGSWLTRTVEDQLTERIEDATVTQLAAVRDALAQGERPEQVALEATEPGVAVWVLLPNGDVVSSSPWVMASPPTTMRLPGGGTGVVRLDRLDPAAGSPYDVVASADQLSGSVGARFEVLAAATLDPVRRGVDAVRDGMLVAFPLLVAAVGMLTWFLTGRALRPVALIRTEVEAISGSTLDRRVPVPRSSDEVARLAHTMNAMLDRLEDASTRQQRFVADASHELRSPVAAIRTELEVAQRTAAPEDWPAVAERLLAEEARLEAVIADLLLLASLDEDTAGDMVVVDLAEVAEEEGRQREPDREGVRIEVDAPQPVLVRGNRLQLRRAVGNLLDNAGRHAHRTVRLSVHRRDGHARLLVDDDGTGIPEADRERVFERFTRLDDHRARAGKTSGAGLGLSLVRRIAQRHGGSASIDTAPLGGARVVVDLPLAE